MLHKLRGIVLRTTPYSDSSVIVRIFTDHFGMQSYIINGVRKKKASITPTMLQPLMLVEIEAYQREQGGLQRLRELRLYPLLEQLLSAPLHGLAAGLVAECLNRAIREEQANDELFHWLQQQIAALDVAELPGVESLALLTRLTDWLGFRPQQETYQAGSWLNLNEGVFELQRDQRSAYANPQTAQQWAAFLAADAWSTADLPGATYLDDLLRFYQLHLPGFSLPRSLPLYREMLL